MDDESISVQQLGRITAYDEEQQPVTLATLWAENPAVLVLVRHFG